VKGLVDLSRQGTHNVGFSVPSLDLLVAATILPPEPKKFGFSEDWNWNTTEWMLCDC